VPFFCPLDWLEALGDSGCWADAKGTRSIDAAAIMIEYVDR